MQRFAVSFLILFATACDDVGTVVTDRGKVCIDREQVLEFRQSGELSLTVELDCESACARGEEATCEASIDGPFIRLASQFVWDDSGEDCSAQCEPLAATCTVPETFPGSYTLVHGEDQFDLELPSNPLIDCLSPMEKDEQR